MAARRKTTAPQTETEEQTVPDEAPHYLDRFGHRHEITDADDDDDTPDEQPLPALPPTV